MVSDIKPGDLVRLKTGDGPTMVVGNIEGWLKKNKEAVCVYHESNYMGRTYIHVAALEKVIKING